MFVFTINTEHYYFKINTIKILKTMILLINNKVFLIVFQVFIVEVIVMYIFLIVIINCFFALHSMDMIPRLPIQIWYKMDDPRGLEQLWPNKWVGRLQILLIEKQNYCDVFPLSIVENDNNNKLIECVISSQDWCCKILEVLREKELSKLRVVSGSVNLPSNVVILQDKLKTELGILNKPIGTAHVPKDLQEIGSCYQKFCFRKSNKYQ